MFWLSKIRKENILWYKNVRTVSRGNVLNVCRAELNRVLSVDYGFSLKIWLILECNAYKELVSLQEAYVGKFSA
jgi:hypothetical protein